MSLEAGPSFMAPVLPHGGPPAPGDFTALLMEGEEEEEEEGEEEDDEGERVFTGKKLAVPGRRRPSRRR